MSRARQVANFDPALFAADEVSGDKVSGGTIGAGVIGASVTGGAGLSGMTSLGTVATGNLSNTDIVYPAGHVLQVVQTVYTDAITDTNGAGTFTYFLSMTINPISTSNKVLVLAAITGGTQTHSVYYKLQHNGSGSYADVDGAKGVAAGSRTRITSYGVGGTSDNAEMQTTILCYLDSPSKDSSFQYRVGGSVRASGTTWTINRPYDDTDATYTGRGVSTLTLMEVKG